MERPCWRCGSTKLDPVENPLLLYWLLRAFGLQLCHCGGCHRFRLSRRSEWVLSPTLTHLPRNDIPSGILSSNVTFLRATYFVPAVCDGRANQFFEKSCIRPMRPENARN